MNLPDIAEVVQNLQRGINEIDFGGVQIPKATDGGNIMIQSVNNVAARFGLASPLSGTSHAPQPSYPSSLPALPDLPVQASPLNIPQVLGGA